MDEVASGDVLHEEFNKDMTETLTGMYTAGLK
jgi:hypothetical protein